MTDAIVARVFMLGLLALLGVLAVLLARIAGALEAIADAMGEP